MTYIKTSNKLPALIVSLLLVCIQDVSAQLHYPFARTESFDTLIYGKRISDPYFWMSRKENEKELLAFTGQQGKLTQTVLDNIPGTDVLMQEWDQAYASIQHELWSMKTVGNTFYYNRDIPGEGTTLCKRNGADGSEEKLLGKVTINGQRYSIRKKAFAHQQPLVALMLTQNGEANPQIRIYDLDKKIFLQDSIAPVMFNDARGVSMTWLRDGKGLLYTQAPPTNISSEKYYNGKIKIHITGTDPQTDVAIFGTQLTSAIALKAYETPYVYSFPNSSYIVARIRSGDSDNYAFAVDASKIKGAETPWVKLQGYVNIGDAFDATGNYLYAVTKGGPKYQVVKINMQTGTPPVPFFYNQQDLIAGTDVSNRSGIVAGKDALYILLRRIGDMQIMKVNYKTGASSLLPVQQKGTLAELSLLGDNDLVFSSGGATRSIQYLHYNHASGSIRPLPFASHFYNADEKLATKVLYIPSRDGKQIPVSLVYKKGIELQNNNPLLIEAYGNSGMSADLIYDPTRIPWRTRGGIYVYAHVRGGGELGNDWMQDGQFPHKMNSINDVVDVADFFIKNKYTSPSRQLIMGSSAGSFLVGMSINQRPDLFAGGLFLAGLPDIVTYRDGAFARESKSVGPIDTETGFLSSYSISSYYHVPSNKKLPAMLVVHGATDYILALHPAARYIARLQQSQKGDRPILLMVDWESGHSGSGEQELLYLYKFALWQTGHPAFQLK